VWQEQWNFLAFVGLRLWAIKPGEIVGDCNIEKPIFDIEPVKNVAFNSQLLGSKEGNVE